MAVAGGGDSGSSGARGNGAAAAAAASTTATAASTAAAAATEAAAAAAALNAVARPNAWARLVDRIASPLAFYPPSPPSYTVEQHRDAGGGLYVQPVDRAHAAVPSARVAWADTASGGRVLTAFVPWLDGRGGRARLTLLYSHGNAVDVGQMLPIWRDLARLLRVNVLGYDYTGYGACAGQPSTCACCCDVAAALRALQELHGVPPREVVLYGQSVGSGPTVWLAAQQPGVAGVVLHSPLLSGVRVLNPGLKRWPAWADVFPNDRLIRRIDAPVLVMHGTHDEVIHVSAAQRLAELAPNAAPPLLAEGFDHQNLEACPEFLPRLRAFLDQCAAAGAAGAGGAGGGGAAGRHAGR